LNDFFIIDITFYKCIIIIKKKRTKLQILLNKQEKLSVFSPIRHSNKKNKKKKEKDEW